MTNISRGAVHTYICENRNERDTLEDPEPNTCNDQMFTNETCLHKMPVNTSQSAPCGNAVTVFFRSS